MAQVRVPVMLRAAVGGERVVAAAGRTVRDVIRDLDGRHPGFRAQLLDPATGELRPYVNVYVNDEDVRYLQGLDTPTAETDAIAILPAVAGGGEPAARAARLPASGGRGAAPSGQR
jgi:molybdopterin converting factor small subunit